MSNPFNDWEPPEHGPVFSEVFDQLDRLTRHIPAARLYSDVELRAFSDTPSSTC